MNIFKVNSIFFSFLVNVISNMLIIAGVFIMTQITKRLDNKN
jgi:hypothetical protein